MSALRPTLIASAGVLSIGAPCRGSATGRPSGVLGVSERSVYRFNQAGDAPRVASLALFWLTRWGRSSAHAQATTDAIRVCGYAEALQRDAERLEARIAHLLTLGNSGAANVPLLGGPCG